MAGLPMPRDYPKWDYREARRWLQVNAIEAGRKSCEAPFGAETTVCLDETSSSKSAPSVLLKHREAVVCKWMPHGVTKLNPSKLRAKSVRMRINVFTRATVYERDGVWFLADPDGGEPWLFADSMEVGDDGKPWRASAPKLADGPKPLDAPFPQLDNAWDNHEEIAGGAGPTGGPADAAIFGVVDESAATDEGTIALIAERDALKALLGEACFLVKLLEPKDGDVAKHMALRFLERAKAAGIEVPE